MFKSIFGLVSDVATIVTAPVEMAVDATRIITKPLAEVAKSLDVSLSRQRVIHSA